MSNETRRARARAEGRDTFRYEVVDDWPACVDCGQPIRRNVDLPERRGLYRLCGCQGVVWRHDITRGALNPWVRESDEPSTVVATCPTCRTQVHAEPLRPVRCPGCTAWISAEPS